MNQQVKQPVIAPHGKRIVAISYRDKEVMRDGVVIEQRPTMVAIIENDKPVREIKLEDEDHEMCFLLSRSITLPPAKPEGKPIVIDYTDVGIRPDDIVLMVMGGSGAFYAFAISNRLETLESGGVYWIGSTLFKRLCDEHKLERSKLKNVDEEGKRTEITFDHHALAELFKVASHHFHRVAARERDLILLQDVLRRRVEAMAGRMACAHRVRQRMKKMAYCSADAYPEGGIKLAIEQGVANDKMLQLLEKEETQIGQELKKLLHTLPVWKVFEPIEGVGEFTAAPLICAIGDINRFPSASQLKAFLGVHTLTRDGEKFKKGEQPDATNSKFARRRQGQLSNWNQGGRQALYQISEQFLKWRKDSPWGLVTKEIRKRFLVKYPNPQVWVKNDQGEVIRRVDLIEGMKKRIQGGWEVTHQDGTKETIKGVTKFNPAHINRMVAWRTMTKFVEWLYDAWKNTEAGKEVPPLPYLANAEKLAGLSDKKAA